MSDGDPRKSLSFRRRLELARAAAALEAVWPAFWPSAAVLGLFLAISLLGVWSWLPAWLHALGLLGFAAAFGWTAWQARGALRWPDRNAGLGRLEAVNALRHQPLRSLGDRLAGGAGDGGTVALWRRHRERLLRSLRNLRVGPPRSDLPRRDPWALRAGLVLLLVVALTEAGSLAPKRLVQAFELGRPGSSVTIPIELTLWVTPPDYTGLPPQQLKATPLATVTAGDEPVALQTRAVQVPVNSEVLAQLHHLPRSASTFELSLDEDSRPFESVGQGSAEMTMIIERSGELRVGDDDRELGLWTIEAVPDQVPEVDFVETPRGSQRGALKVHFEASDDYGVASVGLRLSRPGRDGDVETMELMRPSSGATEIDDSSYLDLTPHRWAGLPAVLQLEAMDGLDQFGRSDPVEIVLPERPFTHPLARAIIEQRRELAAEPETRREVASALSRLSQNPMLYQHDPTVYLALRSAAQRLVQGRGDQTHEDVLELLWDTALYLEDGSLSLAERELRELQEALRDALARDGSDEELERLMAELERAMQEYIDQLLRQAQQQPQDQAMPIDPDAMQVHRQDLQEMLERAREMLRTGARDAARELLAQLQEMLENLQVAQSGQMQQGQQMLNQLQEMIQRQQGLLDDTFGLSRQQGEQGQQGQQGQEGQQGQMGQGQMGQQGQGQWGQQGQQGQGQWGQRPGGQQGGQAGQLAMDQEALRRALGELMGSLGDSGLPIPRALGEAELSMRAARDALQQGMPGSAVDPEAQALDQLRQGGQAMMQEMQRMMAQGQGQGPGSTAQPFGQAPEARDPLGRSMFNQGGADLYGTRVPTELELGRARAIMEELYRRAGERNRPAFELDYLERLLRRF